MGIRTRKPEETMLHLSTGDWLLVKKHLTYGDGQEMFARTWRTPAGGGAPTLDAALVAGSINQVIQYLLDWSISDADGKPIKIQNSKGEPDADTIRQALEDLDPEDIKIIADAVSTHDVAMAKLREAEKNSPAGATASPAISGLPA